MKPGESFVGQPIRSLQTMLRIIAEYDDGYQTVIPDGIYGPETMHAVSLVQRRNSLPITGITDQTTWEQIASLYNEALLDVGKAEQIEILINPGQIFKIGDSGPYIYLLQSMLIQLSQDHHAIRQPEHNGYIDSSTTQAIEDFQKLAALPVTGALDKITWKHLVKQFTLNAHQNFGTRPKY